MCCWDSQRLRFDRSSPMSDIKLSSLFSVRVLAYELRFLDLLNFRSSTLIFSFILVRSSFSAAFSLGSICIFFIFMNFFNYGGLFFKWFPAPVAGPLLSDRFAIFVNIWFFLVSRSSVLFCVSLSKLLCLICSFSSVTWRDKTLIWFLSLLELSTNRDDSSFNYLFSSSSWVIYFFSSISTFVDEVLLPFFSNSCYSSAICFHWVRDWLYLSICFCIASSWSCILDTFFF